MYKSFRAPKTKHSMTMDAAHLIEGIRIRRRAGLLLPGSFDDIQRCYQRSWKEYRKTRWK